MTRWQGAVVSGLGGAFLVTACGGTVDLRWDEAAGGSSSARPHSETTQPAGGALRGSGPRPAAGGTGSEVTPPAAGGESTSMGGAPTEQPGTGGKEPGTGGAPDEITFGGAPTYLDECASDLTQVLPRPDFECPAHPSEDFHCDIPENAGCVWQVRELLDQQAQVGYVVAHCYASPIGKVWKSVAWTVRGPGGSPAGGVNAQDCPKWLPVAGSSCSGHAGEICYYPGLGCSCADDEASWACQPEVGTEGLPPYQGLPVEVKRLCPPEGLDESKQIKELTEEEVLTWCNWHADPSGAPRPEMIDDRAPGGYATYGFGHFGYEWNLCMPDIPSELCVRNFKAVPGCTATLGDLDDCIETFYGNHDNEHPGWVGHGCAPLFLNPSCDGLMVSKDDQECDLPLE